MKRRRPQDTGRKPPSKELAEAITETRIHNNWNQAQFSRRLHKNIVTIGRWERATIVPQPDQLAQLLLLAPARRRKIFEDYLGKTYDQVLKERYSELVNAKVDTKEWDSDPSRYAPDMQNFCHDRIERIAALARSTNKKASLGMLHIVRKILAVIDNLDKNDYGNSMI